jgi:hypothetical protein
MRTTLKYTCLTILAILAYFALFLAMHGMAEAQGGSAAQIIQFLTYQTDRPGKLAAETGTFGCGGSTDDRAAEASLVKLGNAAVPELESALGSLEQNGRSSVFALNGGWLLLAYAEIKGLSARERLLELQGRPQLAFLRTSLRNAISISLSLTSYISSSTPSEKIFRCRDGQPRDAMDQLILAWLRNDQQLFEASLSPRSEGALNVLEEREGWEGMRAQLWRPKRDDGFALGYRFSADPSWSLPDQKVEGDSSQNQLLQPAENPAIETVFVNATGGDCSRREMKFIGIRDNPASQKTIYLVDETDMEGVLRLLSSCAASN